MNVVVELGLTTGHSLETEPRFGLDKPGFDIFQPEGRKLHGEGAEEICSSKDGIPHSEGRVSWHAETENSTVELENFTYLDARSAKNREPGAHFGKDSSEITCEKRSQAWSPL